MEAGFFESKFEEAGWTANSSKKSSKNLPKWSQNEGFWASWGCLGGSWSVLGLLGVSWGRLEASCDRPGGVLGRLGSVLARKRWPTWFQFGSQNGAKIEKKSKPNAIKIWMPLGVGFLKDFGGFRIALSAISVFNLGGALR